MSEHDRSIMSLEMILSKRHQGRESQHIVEPAHHILPDRRPGVRTDARLRGTIRKKIESDRIADGLEGLGHDQPRLDFGHRVQGAGDQRHIGPESTERACRSEQIGADEIRPFVASFLTSPGLSQQAIHSDVATWLETDIGQVRRQRAITATKVDENLVANGLRADHLDQDIESKALRLFRRPERRLEPTAMEFFRVTIRLERIWFGVGGGHRVTAYPEAAGTTRPEREM